jgi:hypothetical protein
MLGSLGLVLKFHRPSPSKDKAGAKRKIREACRWLRSRSRKIDWPCHRFLAALRDYLLRVTFLSIPRLHPVRGVKRRMPNGFVFSLAVAISAAVGFAGLYAAGARPFAAIQTATAETNVDVELVFAVDVSYSMDPDEQALQREGYVTALRSREFLDALQHLTLGRIALTYIEWAGVSDQKILLPWRPIDGPMKLRARPTVGPTARRFRADSRSPRRNSKAAPIVGGG